jgi:arylsulfatase A-like enzyme
MMILLRTLLLLPLFLAFTSAAAREIDNNQKPLVKNLFIIVVDGVRYDDALGAKDHLYTENIWNKLRPLGTICANFYNSELTYPIPAQMSLLTGIWHINKNPLKDTIHPSFPTLFEYWKKKNSDNSCYFASGNAQSGNLTYSDNLEYGKAYAPVFDTNALTSEDIIHKEGKTGLKKNSIYKEAVSYIFKNHPAFVYLNLGPGKDDEHFLDEHDCKLKDKKEGCNGAEFLNAYYESIILFDANVYDLWNHIQNDEIYKDKSVLIILSDHGRHTDDLNGFGDKCRGCRQLNFLIIGPGVKKDFISKKKRTLIDICPTMGALFDIPTPFAKGAIMKEILSKSIN